MSLINDALKRAKQAQQKNTPPPASAPMRPVEATRPPPAPRSQLLPVVVAVGLMILGGAVLILVWNRGSGGASNPESPGTGAQTASAPSAQSVASAAPPQTPQSAGATVVPVAVRPAQSTATNVPQPATSIPTIVTQTVVIVEKSNPEPMVQAVPPEPLPRLQGILFNPAKPTAFLNGKSYVVGGRVGEYQVVAITQQAVTVERAGQTNVLTMAE